MMELLKASNSVANAHLRLYEQLPIRINLQSWGDESYGSIGVDLGEKSPVSDIPPGGIAYTNQGNYLCFFYGQRPAWPIEHVGEILKDEWQQLRSLKPQTVYVSAVEETSET